MGGLDPPIQLVAPWMATGQCPPIDQITITARRPMAGFEILFPTRLYRANIAPPRGLAETCLAIAAEDKAGQRWARDHDYGGYTSYASLNDLTTRATIFDELERKIAKHVAAFARKSEFDLGGK